MLEATYQIMDRMPNYKSERDRWSWGIGGLHYWKACQLDIDKEELLKNLDNKEVLLNMFKKSLGGDKTVLNNSAYNIIDSVTFKKIVHMYYLFFIRKVDISIYILSRCNEINNTKLALRF